MSSFGYVVIWELYSPTPFLVSILLDSSTRTPLVVQSRYPSILLFYLTMLKSSSWEEEGLVDQDGPEVIWKEQEEEELEGWM